MKITPNYTPTCKQNFKAKFVYSDDLKDIVEYAVAKGKFDKINEARKNIDKNFLKIRLRVNIGYNENGFPYIKFTKYEPKKSVIVPESVDDYVCKNICVLQSSKKQNIYKYALNNIIKMGNNAPRNNLYQKIVIRNK